MLGVLREMRGDIPDSNVERLMQRAWKLEGRKKSNDNMLIFPKMWDS